MESSETVDAVCRLLYEQLVILFHEHECYKCEETNSVIQYSALPLCHSVDALLSHMKHCRAGMSCQIPGCPTARIIMSHGKMCRKEACPVALNLSEDRKQKIQLHLQAVVESFSPVEASCQNLNNLLISLFHNHGCEMCMKIHERPDSDLPLCHSMDAMLSHIKYCRAGMSCQVPGCPSARTIISHWKNCKDKACPVLRNLNKDRKHIIQKRKRQNVLPFVIHVNRDAAKNFRQTLFVMFHAWSCMFRRKSQGFLPDCDLPQCQAMQALLRHIVSCVEGPRCKYPKCIITRFLFIHYKACVRHDCEICWPVRSVIKQLCGTNERSARGPSIKVRIRTTFTATADRMTDPRFSALIYRWILTRDKPLIGPPLLQKRKPKKSRSSALRRWKKKSRIICSWMRKHPCIWRRYTSVRLQLQTRGRNSSAVPFPL